MQAIVLAAGQGSRLAGLGAIKPLVRVAGVTLLDRVLGTLREAGATTVAIVIGCEAESLAAHVAARRPDGLEVALVHNRDWHLQNGVSLLAAAGYLRGPTLLSMADHLYGPDVPRALLAAPPPRGGAALAVDRDVARVFDLDDATKVRTQGERIVAIGKDLTDYDAIDSGVFLVTEDFVEALCEVREERGDCSLSEGVRRLAGRGRMWARDVTGKMWLDVDTPEALREAERRLRGGPRDAP